MDWRSRKSIKSSQAADKGRIIGEEDRSEWEVSENRKESEEIGEDVNKWMVIFQ